LIVLVDNMVMVKLKVERSFNPKKQKFEYLFVIEDKKEFENSCAKLFKSKSNNNEIKMLAEELKSKHIKEIRVQSL
jgi:hypothetical protein